MVHGITQQTLEQIARGAPRFDSRHPYDSYCALMEYYQGAIPPVAERSFKNGQRDLGIKALSAAAAIVSIPVVGYLYETFGPIIFAPPAAVAAIAGGVIAYKKYEDTIKRELKNYAGFGANAGVWLAEGAGTIGTIMLGGVSTLALGAVGYVASAPFLLALESINHAADIKDGAEYVGRIMYKEGTGRNLTHGPEESLQKIESRLGDTVKRVTEEYIPRINAFATLPMHPASAIVDGIGDDMADREASMRRYVNNSSLLSRIAHIFGYRHGSSN